MLFIRTLQNPSGTPRPLGVVRSLCLTALLAYPIGGLVRVLGPDTFSVQMGGLSLMVLSIVCAAIVIRSRVSHITGDVADQLDEYERHLRASSLETSYSLMTGIVLLGIIYVALASDFGWWVPAGYEQWNAIFWGVFLMASLMPATVLSFRLAPADLEDGGA